MKTESKIIIRLLCFEVIRLCIVNFSNGQDTIYLRNPSFEDKPRSGSVYSSPIKDWTDCGLTNFPDESPPDIFSSRVSYWGVSLNPYDGKTYLSVVTRYNDSYESISQSLSKPLDTGKCYRLTAFLALSEKYESGTLRMPLVEFHEGNRYGTRTATENFSNPVELFVWGGDASCRTHQLLVRSGPVSNHDWAQYELEFSPKETYQYITIGAFFEKGYTEPYNGHVLVDNLSPIFEIECK
ncbi:MAG: hypothetical protein WBP41_14725 [Saprospiraceae bacterium]